MVVCGMADLFTPVVSRLSATNIFLGQTPEPELGCVNFTLTIKTV